MQFKNRKEYEPTHIKTLVEMLNGDKEKAASLMGCHYATVVTAIREDVATRRQEISAHKAIIRLETEESIKRRQEAEAAQDRLNELLPPPNKPQPVLPVLKHDRPGMMRMLPPGRGPLFIRPVEEAQVVDETSKPGPIIPPQEPASSHMVQLLVSVPANKLQSFHRVTALMGAEVAEL